MDEHDLVEGCDRVDVEDKDGWESMNGLFCDGVRATVYESAQPCPFCVQKRDWQRA